MKAFIVLVLLIMSISCLLVSCAPLHDVADGVSNDFGEVSDELGKERTLGSSEDAIVVHPQADKKIRMDF